MDEFKTCSEQPLADVGIGWACHAANNRRPVSYYSGPGREPGQGTRAGCGMRGERLWFPPARLAAYMAVSATLTRSSMRSRSAGSKLGPSGTLTMPILAVMG